MAFCHVAVAVIHSPVDRLWGSGKQTCWEYLWAGLLAARACISFESTDTEGALQGVRAGTQRHLQESAEHFSTAAARLHPHRWRVAVPSASLGWHLGCVISAMFVGV